MECGTMRCLGSVFLLGLLVAGCGPGVPSVAPEGGHDALVRLGARYADLHAGAEAILNGGSPLDPEAGEQLAAERLQVIAGQLAGELAHVEHDFEQTTASLRTDQLDAILPLWERMAMAQAGLSLLRDEALQLREDPSVQPYELLAVAEQLEAVLELALAGQQGALEGLKPPQRLIFSGT